MALPQLPPPVDISTEAKKGIIEGVKKVIAAFHDNGILDKDIGYRDVIHDPEVLCGFIQAYRDNPRQVDDIVVQRSGEPVMDETTPLVCGVTLAQVQQLLVKTCARYFLEQDTKEDEEIVTETVTKTRFLFFKMTEQVERRQGGGFDERKVREITRHMAFDWQLPMLRAYCELTSAQLMELDRDLICLQSADAVRDLIPFDQGMIKKAKGLAGDEFPNVLATRPAAVGGIAQWSKDMYGFYRGILGDKAWEFFAREKPFFMVCASLDKPVARVYGDVLAYIAAENLAEMQRLNIDKADVLIAGMKFAFGDKLPMVLSQPALAKDVLRKLVESLLHLSQEKAQMAISTQITCKAIAPQVMEWLAKQPAA